MSKVATFVRDITLRVHKKHPSRGWTLLEMMVVVVVLGVVMAIALPSIRRARMGSRIQEAQAQVELLSAAIMQLAWDTGRWPTGKPRNNTTGQEAWDLTVPRAGLVATDGSFPDWNGPYIREIPEDPWGNPYFFDEDYSFGGKTIFVVGSFGPNGNGRNVYDSDNIFVQVAER